MYVCLKPISSRTGRPIWLIFFVNSVLVRGRFLAIGNFNLGSGLSRRQEKLNYALSVLADFMYSISLILHNVNTIIGQLEWSGCVTCVVNFCLQC